LESNDAQRNQDWPEDVVDLLRLPEAVDSEDSDARSLYADDGSVTLARVVDAAGGRLTFSQVARFYRAILETIGRLHGAGFVHLQLTPSNIILRPRDQNAGLSLEETTADTEDDDTQAGHQETDNLEAAGASDLQSDDSGEVGGESTSPGTGPADIDALEESTDSVTDDSQEVAAVADPDSEPTLQDLYPLAQDVVTEVKSEMSVESEDYTTSPGTTSAPWLEHLAAEAVQPPDDRDDGEGLGARSEGQIVGLREVERAIGSLERANRDDWIVELVPDGGVVSRDHMPSDPETHRGYSSPEVVAGRASSPTPLAPDIFSAGMMLYFLITGERPPASVYSRHAPAIPTRNLRFSFPPGLEPVIKRATRPSADERFPDVDAMTNAFEEAVDRVQSRQQQQTPKLIVGAERHVGIAKRRRNPVNQDRVFRAVSNDGQFGMVAVADGVSTATFGSGEIASRMFVDAAADAWDDLLPDYIMEEPSDDAEAVRDVLLDSNERIVEWVNERHTPFEGSPHEVMGTTALIALYRQGVVTLGSLGDSRAYLQSGPGLEQLSIDHNLWTLSILDGMEADEALSMPQGEALARCLGTFDLDDGQLEAREPDYDLMQYRMAEGDSLLLTTDGLVDFAAGTPVAAEENILATLLSEPNPELACLELILLANRGGGGDNIGMGILRFK
jgi:protein phosphatase